jgi:hypothetical protein
MKTLLENLGIKNLLENLGITLTCTHLCGDYHHVINEVWPKQSGLSKLKELKPYLTCMIKSNTESEYKLLYDIAIKVIQDNPLRLVMWKRSTSVLNTITGITFAKLMVTSR